MQHALAQPGRERALWLPPARMRQYAIARIVGGVLFAAIFAVWMAVQWSNVAMRFLAGGLIAVTAWVTAASIATDARRMRGRQVEWTDDLLVITTPAGESRLPMADIAGARWSGQADDFGLSFHDRHGSPLARLDENFLADEAEARAFLRWLRSLTNAPLEVRWQ